MQGGGAIFPLTAGLDTKVGGAGNDSFEGTTSTFQAFDNINGNGGTDTLTVLQVPAAAANLEDGAFQNTKSVENVVYEATGKSANLGAIAAAAGVNSLTLGGTSGDANLTGFAGAISVTGNAGVNVVTFTLADTGVKTLDLGSSGASVDQVTINGATNQIRLTFASGEVGNGSSINATAAGAGQAYAGEAVGGLAVRIQEEDAAGNLPAAGTVHRAEDEGVQFVNGNFDVRDLATGTARGTFNDVYLLTSGADTLDINGFVTPTYINGGAGADVITGGAKADFLVGGAGADTIVTTNGADSVLGGADNDGITISATAVVSIDGGAGDDTITVKAGASIAANTTTAKNNATIAGGDGRDTLVADSAVLVAANIDNTVAGAVQSISGIEVISVANQLGDALTLSKIQAGILAVNVKDSNTKAITFDSGVAGTVTLGAAETGASINITSAGTGTADALTIAGTKSVDNFAGKAINANGVETLTIAGGTAGDAKTQTIGVITVTGTGTAATTVAFTGSNAVNAGAVEARNVDASGLTGSLIDVATTKAVDAALTMTTATAVAKTTFSVIGSGQGDTITLGTGDVNVQAGAGNDTVIAGANLSVNDTLNGGDGTDRLAIGLAATAESSIGVSNFEVLRIDAAISQDMVQFQTNPGFARVEYNVAGNSSVTNAAAATTEIRLLNGSGTAVFDRLLDNTTNALTIGALTDVNTTVTTLTVDDEETLTIGQGGITTAGNDFIVTTLNADDLVTLNITGSQDTKISNAIAGANDSLATVNASAATGTVSVSVASATIGVTVTGSATAASTVVGGTVADVITGGAVGDNLDGKAGNDTISGGGGADTITGGLGSDSMTGGAGDDDFVLALGDSRAPTAVAFQVANAVSNGDVLTFQFGVDIITDFVTTADDLDVVAGANTAPTSLIGVDPAALAAGVNYTARGTFNAASNTFTFAATGADTIVVQSAAAPNDSLTTNTSIVILTGIGANVPVAADFI